MTNNICSGKFLRDVIITYVVRAVQKSKTLSFHHPFELALVHLVLAVFVVIDADQYDVAAVVIERHIGKCDILFGCRAFKS